MTKKTIEEMIAVMQAYKDGKEIEYFSPFTRKWWTTEDPLWDWDNLEYRVKAKSHWVDWSVIDSEYKYLWWSTFTESLVVSTDKPQEDFEPEGAPLLHVIEGLCRVNILKSNLYKVGDDPLEVIVRPEVPVRPEGQ